MPERRRPWTPAEDAVLRATYADLPTRTIAETLARPLRVVYARAHALGLAKSAAYLATPASGRVRPGAVIGGGRARWTPEEDAALRARYADESTAALARELGHPVKSAYRRAQMLGLKKSAAYLASGAAGRLVKNDPRLVAGLGTRFRPGQTPANKGVKRGRGWAPGRMREGQFRKGERHGVAARVYQPIGAERVSVDGYLERKVNNDLPFQKRWRAVHLLVWEAAHGPLPPGHAVTFVSGDKRDVRLENLALVSRQELMRRNTVHNYPKPIAEAIQLLGALNRKINRRARQAQEQSA